MLCAMTMRLLHTVQTWPAMRLYLLKLLGYSGDDLHKIVVGALVHDLGKLEISDRILSKPGKLDEFEFREIQNIHTGSPSTVKEQKSLSHGQLMMVYQHHEKLDGSGYPSESAAKRFILGETLCCR